MQVTQHVALLSRWISADLYAKEIDLLQFELSMPKCTKELWSHCELLFQKQQDASGAPALTFCLALALISFLSSGATVSCCSRSSKRPPMRLPSFQCINPSLACRAGATFVWANGACASNTATLYLRTEPVPPTCGPTPPSLPCRNVGLPAEPVPRTRSLHQLPGRADMGPSAVVLDNTNVVTNAALRSPSPLT